jgi:hypothetical protein
MSETERAGYVTREAVLKLLSNEEIGKVSTAEAAAGLKEGQEYLDLEHLERGIQQAGPGAVVKMGHILPRSAVSTETWTRIAARLATQG